MEVDPVTKKEHSKRNLVRAFGFGSGKIIFILLIEVVVFYIRFTIVHVQEARFQ